MLTVWDFVLPPLYVLIIFAIGKNIKQSKIKLNPEYEFFTSGLLIKIMGAIIFCLVYTLYYDGGDTNAYHEAAVSLKKLSYYYTNIFFKILSGNYVWEYLGYFDYRTGYPQYWKDPQAFMVVRLTSILEFLSFNSYIATSVMLAALSFSGIWKLYRLFCMYYPQLTEKLTYTTIFIPSVVFWGSGILKDTYTITGACWFTYHMHQAVIKKDAPIKNAVIALIAGYLVLKIKPYIILSLVPGALLWFAFEKLKSIKNSLARIVFGPILFSTVLGFFLLLFSSIKGDLGAYSSVESILNKASVTQKDLKQDYNQGNAFDIGEFEPTIPGVLKKFPIAVFSGIFRPTLLDARNIVMIISALENTIILFAFLYVLFSVGILRFYSIVSENPIIFFSLLYAVIFGFSVGLSTSNFGALVRYKIPCTPFFLSGILMVWQENKLFLERNKLNNKSSLNFN
jgi:hypothetical protein